MEEGVGEISRNRGNVGRTFQRGGVRERCRGLERRGGGGVGGRYRIGFLNVHGLTVAKSMEVRNLLMGDNVICRERR